MQTVNYITRPWFFDISIELIKELKQQVNLNVILIISPASASYLGISPVNFDRFKNSIANINDVLSPDLLEKYKPYLIGAQVLCKFEEHKKSSYQNTLVWIKLLKEYPHILRSDLHLIETLSLSDWYFLFKIVSKKKFYIVHDPVPHTGEGRTRTSLIAKIYFPCINKFLTYSYYSLNLF